MKSEIGEKTTRILVILICIVLNLSLLLVVTASGLQTTLSTLLS
jgi:hypothetical protein